MLSRRLLILFGLCLLSLPVATVAEPNTERQPKLLVGTNVAPPFSMKAADGGWDGISIQLWRGLAEDLGLEYELHERGLEDLLDDVANGELDLAIAALSVTAERERSLNFSNPYYATGLAIAVPANGGGRGWLHVLERVFSKRFVLIISFLVLLLLAAGSLVWVFERRRNPDMFGSDAARGIGSGFWWAAVTSTTVGYGDKVPKSFGGRVVGLLWMFASIVILSSFMATITATLTVGELSGRVRGIADLAYVRVGTISQQSGVGVGNKSTSFESSSVTFLTEQGIASLPFESTRDGLQAIIDGEIDAFVVDEPILRYLVKTEFAGRINVLSGTFDKQYYAIALRPDSPLRENLNRALLARIERDEWIRLLEHHLGPED